MKAVLVFTVALCLFAAAGLADEPTEMLIAPSEEPAYPTGCTTDCYVPLAQPAADEFPVSEPTMDPYVAVTDGDVVIAKTDGTTAKAEGFDMRKAGTITQKGATAEGVAMQMYYADARPCNSSENWQARSHCDSNHAPWWGTCYVTGCLVRNGWVVYSWSGYTLSLGAAE